MPSTVIRRFLYSPGDRKLCVEFTTGRRYVYSGVPEAVATGFRSAFSKGTYFNSRIRDHFEYCEVFHEDERAAATPS